MIISQTLKRPLGLDLAENRLELPYGAHVLPDGQKLLGRIGRKLFLPRPPIGVHLNVGQMDGASCKYFFRFYDDRFGHFRLDSSWTARIASRNASETGGWGKPTSLTSDTHISVSTMAAAATMNSLDASPIAWTPRISPNRAPASTFTIPVPPSCSTRNLPATAMGTTDFLYSIPRALTSSSVLPTEETSG